MRSLSETKARRSRQDGTKGNCVKSLPIVLVLIFVGTSALSADIVPTNEVPVQIAEILRQAGELNVGYKEREAFMAGKISAMGSEGIDVLIRELKKPYSMPGPHGGEMRVATFASTAARIYAGLGQQAYDRLREELQRDSSRDFWMNACYVYACSDHDDSFDTLATWVTTNRSAAASRSMVSARAYDFLRVKLERNHLPIPPFANWQSDYSATFRDWWQSNRQTVFQQYLQRKQDESQGAKTQNK